MFMPEDYLHTHKLSTPNLAVTLVSIVTYESGLTIYKCIESVLAQSGFVLGTNLHIIVTDNASKDNSLDETKRILKNSCNIIENKTNLGFSAAHNNAIKKGLDLDAKYFLILNPDVKLDKFCLKELVTSLDDDADAGSSCPKLYRADENLNPISPLRFDAAGMYITPSIRHFDRGSEEIDLGQYEKDEYVFGGSGACLLLRKDFIKDTAIISSNKVELFDEDFFAYREDADLAWRAAWLGWKCRYVPAAIGFHKRVVLPERRKTLPAKLNEYGVRNRFLLQIKNFSFYENVYCIIPALCRNILVVFAVLIKERTSIQALKDVFKLARTCRAKRKDLFSKKRALRGSISKWFRYTPYTESALSTASAEKPINTIHAIIVNYNSGARLKACLESLLVAKKDIGDKFGIQITVIDNASLDSSAVNCFNYFGDTNCAFIFSETNLGFSGAINEAVRETQAQAYLILNPDVLVNANCLIGLRDELSKYSNLGTIAPILVDTDGKPQTAFIARNFPTVTQTLFDLFYLDHIIPISRFTASCSLANSSIVNNYFESKNSSNAKPLLIPQPPASCLLVRDSAFAAVNGFNTSYWPAWFEDVDFLKRLHSIGYLSAVTAKARVIHEGGYSKKEISDCAFASSFYHNMLYYWKIHGKGYKYVIIRSCFPLAMLLRGIVTYLRSLIDKQNSASMLSLAKQYFRLSISPNQNYNTKLSLKNKSQASYTKQSDVESTEVVGNVR
jgi:GT2 family glycosyltransferase